jgi:shikimate kinase
VRGTGLTTGAITLVNALFTGIGSAAGIDLKVRVECTLTPVASREESSIQIGPAGDSLLAREAVKEALRFFAPLDSFQVSLAIESEIPAGRGLKSSSAVSTAIDRAISQALGKESPPIEVARRSADLTQRIGLSATGAFDDALAGLIPGIVVTNNQTRQVARIDEVDSRWVAILWIPAEAHPPSPELLAKFQRRAHAGRKASECATAGKFGEAMAENTALVERVMGYHYRPLRKRLLANGAIACGVSGMGPCLAAIATKEQAPEIARQLPPHGGDQRVVPFARILGSGGAPA